MAMDWSNFGGAFMAQPQEDVEDDEDFYSYDQNQIYTNIMHPNGKSTN
jgi:hypothetical protein